MQRSITIPFSSGAITFSATYDDPSSEKDFGYLLDDGLKHGGMITFEQVIPRLNHFCRNREQGDHGTTITATGSADIEGVTVTATATAELNCIGVDEDEVKGFLKSTIVRDTLGYLVEKASTPDLPEALADILGKLFGKHPDHHPTFTDLGDTAVPSGSYL